MANDSEENQYQTEAFQHKLLGFPNPWCDNLLVDADTYAEIDLIIFSGLFDEISMDVS